MNSTFPWLILEDNPLDQEFLRNFFKKSKIDYVLFSTVKEGRRYTESHTLAHGLFDLQLLDEDSLQFAEEVIKKYPTCSIYMASAFGEISQVVKALKFGARDFIEKPYLTKVLEGWLLESLQVQAKPTQSPGKIAHAPDSPLVETLHLADLVASKDCPVFIHGESGTGKELIAKRIHQKSSYFKGKFIAVNCGAIPFEIMESQFFGHVQGAFSGATHHQKGYLSEAEGGTLFLDEIAELPLALQTKLLRVLQEKEYIPLGKTLPEPTNFRLISATHKNLREEITRGNFREDLFYRVHVFPIHIPPLRERSQDIPWIIRYYLASVLPENELEKCLASLDPLFLNYPWPGNIRELKNCIDQYKVYQEITPTLKWSELIRFQFFPSIGENPPENPLKLDTFPKKVVYGRVEITPEVLQQALAICGHHRQATANYLGISKRTLQYKLAHFRMAK